MSAMQSSTVSIDAVVDGLLEVTEFHSGEPNRSDVPLW